MGFPITKNPPTLSRYGLLLIGIILVCFSLAEERNRTRYVQKDDPF